MEDVLDIPAVKLHVVPGFETAVFPYTTDVPLLGRYYDVHLSEDNNDILRDRERGVPRYNEFRRQLNLLPLDSIDFLEIVYEPGTESHPQLYRHPGTEMVLVLDGRLDIYIGFGRNELSAGDSIHFPSSLPHRYVNPTDKETRAVTVLLHEQYY